MLVSPSSMGKDNEVDLDAVNKSRPIIKPRFQGKKYQEKKYYFQYKISDIAP